MHTAASSLPVVFCVLSGVSPYGCPPHTGARTRVPGGVQAPTKMSSYRSHWSIHCFPTTYLNFPHLQNRPDMKNRASKVSSMNRSLSRTHTPSCLLPWPLMPCHPNTSGDIAKLSASLTLHFSPNIQHHLSRFLWWVLRADRGSCRYSHLHYPFPPYKSWRQTADFSLWDLWTRMMAF